MIIIEFICILILEMIKIECRRVDEIDVIVVSIGRRVVYGSFICLCEYMYV